MKKRLVLVPVIAFFTAPLSLKRIVAVGLVLAVALVPFAMAFSAQEVQPAETWSIETVDSEGWVGRDTSIALDSGNNPHISYRDWTNWDLKYARWTGLAWNVQTVDSAGYVGLYTSLALDPNNNPHISYRDDTNWDLKYAKWTGSAWSIQTVDSAGSYGSDTSIALDSNNNPHISYFDGTNFALKYARWTGSAWSIQTVDSAGSVGLYTSLALDPNNNPHISYYDSANWDLKYARWTGSAWSIQTVDSAGEVGGGTSIALDSNNNPHISYYEWTNSDLKYAKWTGSAWSIQTVDSAGWVGGDTSIALDSGNNPHISYHGNGYLKYARWTGLAWNVQTVDSAGSYGSDTSIALDSNNNPHISYYDDTNRDLKYARPLGYSVFSVSVDPPSQTVTAGDSVAHTVTATLLAGSPGTVSLSLDLPTSVGVYTFTPPAGTPTFTSTLIIHTHKTASAGIYILNVTATPQVGPARKTSVTLEVQACPTLTLDLTPQNVARGQPLLISGRLTPAQAAPIQLYYRYPHRTGSWKLATTINTNPAGYYGVIVTVPASLTPGSYDLVAVWFNQRPGTYAASPVTLLTVSFAMAFSAQEVQPACTWSIQTVDSAGWVGGDTSIALDSNNNPHISYFDMGNFALKYAKWTGTTWNIQTVDSAGDIGLYTSIALDSGNNPHISYYDDTNHDLKYARWTGSAWSIQTVDSAGWVGYYTSIALDSNNNPHISYFDVINGYLKYARWTGSAWSIQTVDSAGIVGLYTSLALDSNNNPHISYNDDINNDLKYARWTGSAWSIQTVDSADYVGLYTSIALDSAGNPHISYHGNCDLKYARWTGSAWSIETVDSAGSIGVGSVGFDTSIALDSSDRPHISYYDDINRDLKYARVLGYSVFSVSVNPPSQMVTAGDSVAHTVTATLLAGSPGTVSLSLDLPPSVGVYTFTPPAGTPTFTSTLIIHTHKAASAAIYNLNVIATPEVGPARKVPLTLEVQACPTLTLDVTPQTVARGQPLLISGRLTPAQTATIQLYYRYPHRTGPWKLATTINTNPTGYYSAIVTVPASLTPGSYDLVAVWFNQRPGTYAASPVALLTVI